MIPSSSAFLSALLLLLSPCSLLLLLLPPTLQTMISMAVFCYEKTVKRIKINELLVFCHV